jgi:nicotinamidase/pyrazinamidase
VQALLIIDVQNDFLPGGALAVPDGDAVIAPLNAAMADFDLVVATQDWHPADHGSFAVHHPGHQPGEIIALHGLAQVLWPAHCVQGSAGAAFADALAISALAATFRKGADPTVDSYSAFFDNGHRNPTGLADYLRERGVTALTVGGLATDYCVKFTVLDALAEGFAVTVLTAACRAVDLQPGDGERALAEMAAAGATLA